MIDSLQPKFYRQRFILAMLGQAGGSLSKMDFQKLLFLSQKKAEFQYYDFVPYRFGCYSFQAASDIEVLESLGWLKLERQDIRVIKRHTFSAGLKSHEIDAICCFMKSYNNYRGRKLIRYVYQHYPYYAIKSEIACDVVNKEVYELIMNVKKKIQKKESILYTIGYEGLTFDRYVNQLVKNDVQMLCDVRKNPLSRKFGFSKGTLSRLLPKTGITYLHLPELGIVSQKRKNLSTISDYAQLFEEYRKTLPEKDYYLKNLAELVKKYKRIALTCFEKYPSSCHRHCLSDYMETRQNLKVVHL